MKLLEKINPRTIFLIDGIGAMVSAIMLGIVLTKFEEFFGMPRRELHFLAIAALVFCVYSLTCFFRFPKNWKRYLRIIAILNLIYCCITLTLIFLLRKEMTNWGVAYFVGEIFVIIFIAYCELKKASL